MDSATVREKARTAVQDMYLAYEQEDVRGFMKFVSDWYTSTGNNANNYSQLELALLDDFKNLQDINFKIYIETEPVYYSDLNRVSFSIRWQRKASLARSGQVWDLSGKTTTFVFEFNDRGDLVLARVEGDVPFGLANPFGVITISDGKLDGTTVTSAVTVENGQSNSSTTVYTDGSTPDITVLNQSWYFSTKATGAYASGDIYYTSDAGDTHSYIGISDDGLRLRKLTGYATLQDVSAVPTTGYVAFYADPAVGDMYAVETKSGDYAVIKIRVLGGDMDFDYRYPVATE
jgi:hypothetical protein